MFSVSETESYYWTGTSLLEHGGGEAVCVAFGQALGYQHGEWIDVHGAGAQRGDPKTGDPADYAYGRGPKTTMCAFATMPAW